MLLAESSAAATQYQYVQIIAQLFLWDSKWLHMLRTIKIFARISELSVDYYSDHNTYILLKTASPLAVM